MDENKKNSDWMFSDNIFKRSISVFLYSLLGSLIIWVPLMILMVFLGIIIGATLG